MKKIIASTLVAAAALVGFAGGASGHTPEASHACTEQGATLTVHLVQYERGSTVTVNGTKSVFGQAEYKTTFNLGPADKPHTWTVVIDNKGDGMNKADKYDATFTDTTPVCVEPILEDKDLTPVVTTTVVTYPATPICMVPGKHLFNAHDPECVTDTVVIAPPAVLERQPEVRLAFTGSEAKERAVMAGALLTIGMACLLIGRRFGKVV